MVSLLEVEGLGKKFGGIVAARDVSLRVETAEIVSIIGPNGAGKTTVLNMLGGVITPTAGTIRLNGDDVTQLPAHRRARLGIARTFQNLALFKSGTVLDNIRVGFHGRVRSGVFAAIAHPPSMRREEAALRDEAERIAHLLDIAPLLNATVWSLSYGQQKRVELARALAAKPRLLLLDELLAGMNLHEKHGMAACLFGVRNTLGCGIVMIEHDLGFVMDVSDRIYVLNFGNPIASGIPADIGANPEVIAAYVGRPRRELAA
jgi:branched-chain amino acid transport system ATP-binding protein